MEILLAKLFDGDIGHSSSPPPSTSLISPLITTVSSSIHSLLDKYWYQLTRHQKNKLLIYSSLVATTIYILTPSIFSSSDKMLSRQRPDKYTTGLINMTIDCFANSTLQSLLALPGLNEYLNELCNAVYNNEEIRSNFSPPDLPLHELLIGILSNLQKIVYKSKTISVWDFLNVLERIFKSKISKNQHDAHELLQLILETLFQENLQLYKYALRSGMSKTVQVPLLPFKSLLLNQLQCTVCGDNSNLNYNPMMILTLPVPQESSIELPNLIKENERELIEGYSCLRCKINAIINLETQKRFLSDDDLSKLKKLQESESLMINDDLPEELDLIIKNYKPSNGFNIDTIRTTIYKKNDIIKAPKILPIHLSRSIFANTQELRNSCQVLFPEELFLETDEKLASELTKIENEKMLEEFDKQDLEPIKEEEFLKPNILKDIEEKQEDAFYEDVGQVSDVDDDNVDSADEADEEFNDEDVEEDETPFKSTASSPIFKKGFEETPPTSATVSDNNDKMPQHLSLQNTIADSVDPLAVGATTKHKYKLKSVIRHVGTHQAGHYECYRHKPEFFKIDAEEFEIKFPFLINGVSNDDEELIGSDAIASDSQTTDPENSKMSRSSSMKKSRSASISRISRPGSVSRASRSGSVQITSDEPQSVDLSRTSSSKRKSSRFSRRLSSFLSPNSNNIDNITSMTDDLKLTAKSKKKKRLGSYVKYPFWRISDSKITETKTDDVLNDNKAVYMLFYERVD